ncbi:polyketide synthase [Favolaschia claudopus]|uniref:Polyketide synthase n=1 Tax=Favolaschia claudopus TaxID=2862362 RepID=A0AAV9YZN6_9AGAR
MAQNDMKGIAVIGIAAQLPSGASYEEDLDYSSFWNFLVQGNTAYEPLANILPDLAKSRPDVKHPSHGAFLKNATGFDNISLGISTRDARVIPYSTRRLLDLSFQALLDSGIESRGRNIGCFMSGNRTLQGETGIDADGSFSGFPYAMANRISYALDLTGPSMLLDTACSSSLYGLHLAVSALQKGECEAALVGAAQINRDPSEWSAYAQGGVLAEDGMCRPMDADAKGFGRGEGAVVVVLKPLKTAIRDNDHIYSVILGSAINGTGSRMPLNVPNGPAQQKTILDAYKLCGLRPSDADYVELHATGTSVGDPIEANATAEIFAKDESAVFGAVKGNIGHLEVASFLASLVKACLMFQHNIIPPTANFVNPAPTINWADYRLSVPTAPIPLGCSSVSGRSTISLSSSGLGGTTGHVVLQAPPLLPSKPSETSTAPILFCVGASSSNAADQITNGVLQLDLVDRVSLRDCAVTLSRRARQLPWRKYFTLPSQRAIPSATLVPSDHSSSLAFVFSGQGPQNLEMGRQLFAEYPVFRQTILEMDAVYRRVMGVSLIESTGLFSPLDLLSASPTVTLADSGWPVTITCSAVAMVQLALFDLLQSVGIVPDLIFGHSAGETAVLYACGAGPKAMAMEIAIARGEAMTCTEGTEVGMAMLACNSERASVLMASLLAADAIDGVLELSCFNAPDSVAVSGTAVLLDKLVLLAKDEGIFAQRIRTMVPGHSSFMDPIKDDYLSRMRDIFSRYPGSHIPRIPVHSTCRADKLVDVFTPEYFWDNCRNAVLFHKAVSDALPSSPIFLEMSCHPVLSSSILAREVSDTRVLCPMRRASKKDKQSSPPTEPETFLDTLGRLSLLGVNSLDLSGLYGRSSFKSKLIEHPVVIRTIPPPKLVSPRLRQSAVQDNGPLSSSNLRVGKDSHPDLVEHVINGEPVFPATGYLELLVEAEANFLWDIEFVSIMSLASSSPLEVSLQRLDTSWAVTTLTSVGEREHARGFMDKSAVHKAPRVVDVENLFKKLPALDFENFYPSLKPLAGYGPRFQRVVRCHGTPAEVIAEIRGPTTEERQVNIIFFFSKASGYLLNPAILDACLHVMLHPSISKQYTKDVMYLPSRLEHFIFNRDHRCAEGNWFSQIRLGEWTPETRSYDILIMDYAGVVVCELRSFVVRKFSSAAPASVGRRFDLAFQPVGIHDSLSPISLSFPERADRKEVQLLFSVLDSMAIDIIAKSLENDPVVGEEESRRRYMAFARGALQRRKEVQVSPEELQYLQEKWPHHFEITKRISGVHETVFQTPQHAVDALYSDTLMAKFYTKSNQTTDVVAYAADAFSNLLDSLRAMGKRSIKILEVGAGTGLFTFPLIEKVKQHADLLIEYTVTDISYALSSTLARNLAYPSAIPKAYDISKDPEAQGIQLGSFDIIVALHVLHAAPSVRACLASLHELLVPGGCILTVELDGTSWTDATKNSGNIWSDTVFGPFAEWFAFTDGRDHVTMPPARWEKLLADVDFVNIQTCVESSGDGREFFFRAQRPISFPDRSGDSQPDLRHIFLFEFGKEIELQSQLRDLDTATPETIYLVALRGRDGDAALGFSASLRKDLPLWDIRLAIFNSSSDLSNPNSLLTQHAGIFAQGESAVLFTQDGVVHVPRVVLSSPPSQNSDESPDSDHVTIRISHWAGASNVFDGFVGEIVESSQHGMSVGECVVGMTEKSTESLLRVPMLHVKSTVNSLDAASAVQLCAAIVSSLIPWPLSAANTRVAVAIEDQIFVEALRGHALKTSGIKFSSPDFRVEDALQRLDLLITDSTTHSQHPHLRRWIPRSGKLCVWDDILRATLRDDPSYIRRIVVNDAKKTQNGHATVHQNGYSTNGHVPHSHIVERPLHSGAAPPFRGDGAYILFGGIGGLGIDLAVWMFQHGARHLTLTSRRGADSLDRMKDALSLAKIAFLEAQSDLELQLRKCDATNVDEMQALLNNLEVPVAGCFLMTLVLSDAPFLKQTQNAFSDVYASKLGVFEVLSRVADLKSLDFLVNFSSISGLVGIAGQTNYASACTSLDGILANYPNAFSLITPGIFDAGYLDRKEVSKDDYAIISADALWAYLEDGLRKLDEGTPFNQYFPDVDWRTVDRQFTLPASCRHLLSTSASLDLDEPSILLSGEALLTQILNLLEVSTEDFDIEQPLATYGLDSLSAAKLSSILRPYASFTPVQEQLQYSAQFGGGSEACKAILLDILGLSSESHVQTTLVEICSGNDLPLIILPGGNGSMGLFYALRTHYKGALWAVQVTDSTPLDCLSALVAFWKDQICEKWPHGPYRFAAYSGSTLLSVALIKMFEEAGEEVLGLTFIDHCPALWLSEESGVILREKTTAEFCSFSEQSLLQLLRIDSTSADALVSYDAAINGLPDAPKNTVKELEVLSKVMTVQFDFLRQFYPDGEIRTMSHEAFTTPFTAWLSAFKAPLALIVVESGFVHVAPGRWADLGANVHYVDGVGHFGLFKDSRVAELLQA